MRIVADVLAGLQYAHELADYGGTPLGVVHRDVSPHNVFVTYDGQVKLMDFGVAKTVAAEHRTRPGGIAGKLAYLAPEYLRNDYAIDRRADVFAVGVMLWEMLAGRRLWHGKADAEIVHRLAAGVRMPDLPPTRSARRCWTGICARALAMTPSERYASAAELEIDLRNVMVGAADSHARTLGRVISHAFATARAERELMIARALVTGKAVGAQPGFVTDPGWAREIDHFLSDADEVLDVTVVDEANVVAEAIVPRRRPVPPLPPPPSIRRRSRVGLGSAVVGMTAVAAIVGFIFAKAPLGASPPAARPAPVTAAAPVHADIAPLPGAVCLGVNCPRRSPADATPRQRRQSSRRSRQRPRSHRHGVISRRRAVDAPGFGRHEDPVRATGARGAPRRPRRIHASRHRDAPPNPAVRRRRASTTSVPLRCGRSTNPILSNETPTRSWRSRWPRSPAASGAAHAQAKAPVRALAQASPRDADDSKLTEAQRRFHRGIDLYKSGDFAAAQVEFTRAYELVPNYKILYNLGQVAYQRHDHAAALRSFRQYLADGVDQISAERRHEVTGYITDLEQRIGRLQIETPEVGAEVFVDDVLVGKTPLRALVAVNGGPRKVDVVAPSGDHQTRQVDVGSGEIVRVPFPRLTLRRAPPPAPPRPAAAIAVTAAPPPAQLRPPSSRRRRQSPADHFPGSRGR